MRRSQSQCPVLSNLVSKCKAKVELYHVFKLKVRFSCGKCYFFFKANFISPLLLTKTKEKSPQVFWRNENKKKMWFSLDNRVTLVR